MRARLRQLLGERPCRIEAVGGSWGFTVSRVQLASGPIAVKAGCSAIADQLAVEATMLRDLARAGLPVPRIIAAEADLLAMDWVEQDPEGQRPRHDRNIGEALAALHGAPAPLWGYGYDTPFGPLLQDNRQCATWLDFLRERRLLPLARQASENGALPAGMRARLERFAERLDRYLPEPPCPSLIHGDLWFENILARTDGRCVFIDPALCNADPESELAYMTMHGSVGRAFFEAYSAHRPIDADFFRLRRDLHLVVPTLVHVILAGPVYAHSIDRTLRRIGL